MNCDEIKKLLPDYCAGDLDEGERRLVENHLESCPDCLKELAGWREYREKLGSLRGEKAPPGFLSRVRGRVEEEYRTKSPLKKFFTPIRLKIPLEAAAAAAVVVLVIYILNITPETGSLSRAVRPPAPGVRADAAQENRLLFARNEKGVSAGRVMEPVSPPLREELADAEMAAAPSMSRPASSGGEGPVELVLLVSAPEPPAPAGIRTEAPLLRMKAVDEVAAETEGTDKMRAQSPPSDRLDSLRELIAGQDGEIIGSEEQSDKSRRILIRLPAGRRQVFLEKLAEISDLPTAPPDLAGGETEILRLRLYGE